MIALEPDVIRAGRTLLTAALSLGKERTDQTLEMYAEGTATDQLLVERRYGGLGCHIA